MVTNLPVDKDLRFGARELFASSNSKFGVRY